MQKRLMDYSAFDIIGPRMIGPSSSHTAGAARLAQVAGKIAGPDVAEVEFVLYGSFAQTGRGHGTDRALLAGILGLDPDDERLRDSFALARERGLAFRFTNSQEEAGHPNTVRIKARSRAGRRSEILGCSIGGGSILITQINGTEVEFTGEYPTVIIRYTDQARHGGRPFEHPGGGGRQYRFYAGVSKQPWAGGYHDLGRPTSPSRRNWLVG